MPTRRGRALLAGALVGYLTARALSVDELFSVALAAAILPLLAVAAVRWGRYRLGFSRIVSPRRLFPGALLRVEIGVRNVGRLPSPPLLLEDKAPPALGGPGRFSMSSLPPMRHELLSMQRRPSARGRYLVGPLTAKLVDPFGLAEATASLSEADPVIVYPRIERLPPGGPPAERAGSGPSAVYRLAPAGEEFYAVREYEAGDDLRRIHWPSVARTGGLMIRQDEARFYPRATLFLDARGSAHRGSGANSSLEWAVSAAGSVAFHLAHEGFAIRMATDERGPTGSRSGREAADPLLEMLAVLHPSGARSLVPGLRRVARRPGAEGAMLAIISPPNPEELSVLVRLPGAYRWCGAIIVDVDSFSTLTPRVRAEADQRLAAAERAMMSAGWRVRSAGGKDRFRDVWLSLVAASAFRQSSASRPS